MSDDSKVERNRKGGKQPGTPKTGGRKKGTPNKKTVWLKEELSNAGMDWSSEFIRAYQAGDLGKCDLLVSLLPYLNPKMKDREVTEETPPQKTEEENKPTATILDIVKSK